MVKKYWIINFRKQERINYANKQVQKIPETSRKSFKKEQNDTLPSPAVLNPLSIPVSTEIFNHYASQKIEGSQGQQEKAFRIFEKSR